MHDYEVVLKRGFNGLKQEMEEKLAALDPASPVDQVDKRPFIEATILVCDAIVLWAKRHADAARKAAEACADPVRKAELIRMAENAEHVPANPARDFYEAVQSQYFTQMFSRLEQKTGTTISNGRMDQYFYPFYKKDMEAGILTDEKTLEYLECMWVGMAEFIDMYISPAGGAFNEGYAHWEAVTIGGQTPDGRDATNDLTYLFLKSKREFPLHYPDLVSTAALLNATCGTSPKPSSSAPASPSCATTKNASRCTSPRARPLKKPLTTPCPAASKSVCPTATPTPPAVLTPTSPPLWKWLCTTAR